MRLAWPLAGVQLGGLGGILRLVGELGEGQAQVIRTDPFGFLPVQFLAERVELLTQGGVLPLRPRQLGLQRRDERARRREIRDRLRLHRHARMIRDDGSRYKG